MTSLANALRSAEQVLGIARVNGKVIDTSSPYPATPDEVIARMAKLMIGMVRDVLRVIAQLRHRKVYQFYGVGYLKNQRQFQPLQFWHRSQSHHLEISNK